MNMLWEFFTFELRLRRKSISTYVYFLAWFLFSFLCVASESFGPIGAGNGKVLLNGAYAASFNDVYISLFGVIIIAAIFGTSILRDFQRDTYQMVFTKPISKFAYLGGRWAGSLATTIFAFSGCLFGEFAGTFAPWADHTRIAPNHFWWYMQPFLSIVVVQIFVFGSLFFMVAALSRKIFVVYVQGAALFIIYLISLTAFFASRSLERFWSGILDPVGFILMYDITRYWTVVEKNSLFLSWSPHVASGVFFYNRLLWLGVGSASLATAWALFPMSVEALTARSQGRRAAKAKRQEDLEQRQVRSLVAASLPRVRQVFSSSTTWAQFFSLSRMRISMILHEIPFWAIVALMIGFAINNGYFAGYVADVNVWPVTYLMLQAVEGSATLFLYIVAGLYAAELIWRERDIHVDGIHDALPMGESVDWLSKLVAITFVEFALLTVAGICGIVMQTVAGYYHYELLQYAKELYVIVLPQTVAFALFAMFVHTMVGNKFVGHGIAIGVFVLVPILYSFGRENSLYLYGNTPPYTYSDMNGYGHFVPAMFWSILYWFAISAFLGVISVAFTRRGADDFGQARLRLAAARFPRLVPAAALCLAAAIGSGGWFYYNAHVLNEYRNSKRRRQIQAEYEKNFKKYENIPQPKVTAVDSHIDIDPARRSFSGWGRYTLRNKTSQPISEIHLTDTNQSVSQVHFDRPFHLVSSSPRDLYTTYELEQPLAPGDSMELTFNVGWTSHGFRDGNEKAELAYNGTFFDSGYFPAIGYQQANELDDPRRRREEHLGPLEEMAPRGDALQSLYNLFSKESDWTSYHTIVSTSADQVAIAPGYLKRQWQENGRNYFEYDMGSTNIADFHAYLSGQYSIRREQYKGVNLEIYYWSSHKYNLDDMLASAKAGLDYFQANFSPYQFQQFRIMEFPRYRTFAQSFSNTVPYSEGIGFIQRIVKKNDIDFTYFVTAHELAHQWWGHQLIGANVQGSNMMAETLAEYSALMVMKQKYGSDKMHRFLRHELDTYLRGRSGEVRHEPPLALVQREPYVWYQKGGQIMYTLADYIGEEKVNLALHNFLMQYRYANASNAQTAAYPDTRQLVAALRAQTPPELQYLIDDGFESIVLYDNKAVSATVTPTADHKFKVSLVVQARKMRADGNGNESPMSLNDYIEIGIFKGKKDEEEPLYLKKEKLTQEQNNFEIVVDQEPTRAGIDPYNKLIDRVADDNMINVTKE
ncbi:MAG TPA: M1 family aminopeptidase [Terriglobales bacterium]|nr:M1 family aminopeptidase [Terriglobales bacterium]